MKIVMAMIMLAGMGITGCADRSDSPGRSADTAAVTHVQAPAADTSHGNIRPDTAATASAAEAANDITGAYISANKLPENFSEIDHLGLATIDENGRPAPLNGFIRPKRKTARDYHLVDPVLNGNALSFSTESVSGISYGFTGSFVRLGNFPANPPAWDEVVLKGTLKKLKDGTVMAELPVEFKYSAGG